MSFVITAGGTAGHICPALAVAAELKLLGKELVFVGSTGGMEEQMALDAGLSYQAFDAKGFARQKPWTLISSSLVLARSTKKAQQWLRSINAEAVAAFGGYASVPVGRAAARENIPLLIQEQNSHMGWTNRYLSKRAQVIALAYDAAADALDEKTKSRVQLTGNPVRQEFSALAQASEAARLRTAFRSKMGFDADSTVLLVFGGSQGARSINNAVIANAKQLMELAHVSVLHLAGRKEAERVKAELEQNLGPDFAQRWQVLDYCNEMPAAFAAADVVLSRAGASSLAELAMACKPSLLVPFPYATADHQRKNAESLVKAHAAQMILDSELETSAFLETLLPLLTDTNLRAEMTKAAEGFKAADAAKDIAELLIKIARK